MHKSTSLMATLTAVFFCPMTCVSASSDSILSAGLMSVSSDYAVFSFEKWAEFTDQSSELALMDYPSHEALSSSGVEHSDYVLPIANRTIEENLWRQTPASVSDYSFNLDTVEQGRIITTIVESEAGTGFNFNWESSYQPRNSLLKTGMKQYLALQHKTEFDFKKLNTRVIHLSADPLEYSIMNDLCFIKHCFF